RVRSDGSVSTCRCAIARRSPLPPSSRSRNNMDEFFTGIADLRPCVKGEFMTLPLAGVRITDFTWIIAGAWGPRQLARLGAEVIRVEWRDNFDAMRNNEMNIPDEDLAFATGVQTGEHSPNRSGGFNNTNAGKRGLSVNSKHPQGKEILHKLISVSDGVVE